MTSEASAEAAETSAARFTERVGVRKPSELLKQRRTASTAPEGDFPDDSEPEEHTRRELEAEDDELPFTFSSPLNEQLFFATLWSVTLSFLFVLLDGMTHKQYGDKVTARLEAKRLGNFLPGMFAVIFLTMRYPRHPMLRLLLFCSSLVGGSYMVFVANTSSYIQVMRRCPPLGTLWIWACIQMDLLPTAVSLAGVAIFSYAKGLKIVF